MNSIGAFREQIMVEKTRDKHDHLYNENLDYLQYMYTVEWKEKQQSRYFLHLRVIFYEGIEIL